MHVERHADRHVRRHGAQAAQDLSPEHISAHLYAADTPDPDFIIRTSGEIRLSGFMLWQSVYSEYYFCDVYWPGFRRVDFLRALRGYQGRARRSREIISPAPISARLRARQRATLPGCFV